MELKVVATGSSGNCYIISNESEAIIIEAGVSLTKVKQALDFDIKKVVGVLISHAHNDHAGYAKDYESVFNVFANSHVIEAKGLRAKEISPEKGFKIGNFKVLPFRAAHDVPCLGFLVYHPEIGNLMFLTDSFLCEYSFPNINHILIECNYSDEALQESIANGLHPSLRNRLMTTHMELKTCKKILLEQDLTNVYNIVLIHLSSNNSDKDQFIETLKVVGKPITIGRKGLVLDLINQPY